MEVCTHKHRHRAFGVEAVGQSHMDMFTTEFAKCADSVSVDAQANRQLGKASKAEV
jgi:hypothetical protein